MLKALILKLAYYITIKTLDYEDNRLMTIRRDHRYNVLKLSGPSCFWDDDFTRCTEQILAVRNHLIELCDNPKWDGLPQLESIGKIPN
tara:strand:+ start:411 stop:674 length:264 start_codon:yes stop_codon:yes gene_type:complete